MQVGGELKAGIAWFAVDPKINGAGKVEGNIKKQGYVALADNNLTMPAIAMTTSGKGAIAFTVMGEDYHPSAGYATIDAERDRRPDPRRGCRCRPSTTGSRATRRSSAIRRGRAGATTAPP